MNNGIILYKGQTLEDNYFNKIISALAWAEPVTVMGKIGTKNQVHIPKSVKKVVEDWMFFGDSATVYFHGTKPPVIVSKFKGNEFTALPIFNKVYVPKKAKKTYIKWAKDRDGLTWHDLHTF